MRDLEGIKKISIPFDLSGGPGPINIYLFCGAPLSLIDTGIKSAVTFQHLQKALADTGFQVEDLERIYLTHGHVDHFGMAGRLAAISGAQIFIHDNDKQKVQLTFEDLFDREFYLFEAYFQESGVADRQWRGYYHALKELITTLAEPVESGVETLTDGELVECGERKLKVYHLPGHTPGSVCFYDPGQGLLFAGDHLLAEISPNPLLELSARARNGYQSLKSYLKSLRRTQQLDISLVLPGHGKNIDYPQELIRQFLRHHAERKKKILDLLCGQEKTKWEISCALFGELEGRQIFLGLSEVEGHLELLEEEAEVVKRKKGPCLYYTKRDF
ncbi:MAG: MBL fold metallo-hydrolase [Desulfobacterales bacterium]|nr:MAG: MBL fold metallo-hydrolase [Desulfobacterales bacterium]